MLENRVPIYIKPYQPTKKPRCPRTTCTLHTSVIDVAQNMHTNSYFTSQNNVTLYEKYLHIYLQPLQTNQNVFLLHLHALWYLSKHRTRHKPGCSGHEIHSKEAYFCFPSDEHWRYLFGDTLLLLALFYTIFDMECSAGRQSGRCGVGG